MQDLVIRIATIVVFCSCAIAQDVLRPGKAAVLEISSGATREYAVQLRPDDYVDILIMRHQNADSTTETNWMAKQFIASSKLPVHFYLDAGTFEVDRAGEGGDILEASRHLRDVLQAKGYVVHYQQFIGGHDGLSWRGTLADGIVALIGLK